MVEKRILLFLFLLSITVAFGCFMGYFFAHAYFSDMETRLQMLETQYANSLKAGQEVRMDEVKILIAKSEESIKDQARLLTWIGLPGTIIALLTAIFGAFKWAAEIAKEKAMEVFKDPETLLKESKKILILTPQSDDETWIRKFIFAFGFSQATFDKIENLNNHPEKNYDIVLINTPDDESGNTGIIADCVSKQLGKSVFYFGKGKATNELLDKEGRLSFANAKSQLYGNLINALKFQKML